MAEVTVRATMELDMLRLGAPPVTVERTPYIDGLLASGGLEVVPGPSAPPPAPEAAASRSEAAATPSRRRRRAAPPPKGG